MLGKCSASCMGTLRDYRHSPTCFTTLECAFARHEDRSADVRYARRKATRRFEVWPQGLSERFIVHGRAALVWKPGSTFRGSRATGNQAEMESGRYMIRQPVLVNVLVNVSSLAPFPD